MTDVKMAERKEVVVDLQMGRYYYVTTWTEQEKIDEYTTRYFSTNPLRYVGKYIGGRMEGWGTEQKEWAYFTDDKGEDVVVTYNKALTTAFYEAYKEKHDEAYKANKEEDLKVVLIPVVGKYYEATFWDRKTELQHKEQHYSKSTTPREYVGQYLRAKQQGYGDSADHWAVFLLDGKEIDIEYDYMFKRAFYEVNTPFEKRCKPKSTF
jgi:CRISPR/Cas system CMR-associated protein Cmr5 small subunit